MRKILPYVISAAIGIGTALTYTGCPESRADVNASGVASVTTELYVQNYSILPTATVDRSKLGDHLKTEIVKIGGKQSTFSWYGQNDRVDALVVEDAEATSVSLVKGPKLSQLEAEIQASVQGKTGHGSVLYSK